MVPCAGREEGVVVDVPGKKKKEEKKKKLNV